MKSVNDTTIFAGFVILTLNSSSNVSFFVIAIDNNAVIEPGYERVIQSLNIQIHRFKDFPVAQEAYEYHKVQGKAKLYKVYQYINMVGTFRVFIIIFQSQPQLHPHLQCLYLSFFLLSVSPSASSSRCLSLSLSPSLPLSLSPS